MDRSFPASTAKSSRLKKCKSSFNKQSFQVKLRISGQKIIIIDFKTFIYKKFPVFDLFLMEVQWFTYILLILMIRQNVSFSNDFVQQLRTKFFIQLNLRTFTTHVTLFLDLGLVQQTVIASNQQSPFIQRQHVSIALK